MVTSFDVTDPAAAPDAGSGSAEKSREAPGPPGPDRARTPVRTCRRSCRAGT